MFFKVLSLGTFSETPKNHRRTTRETPRGAEHRLKKVALAILARQQQDEVFAQPLGDGLNLVDMFFFFLEQKT